MKRTIDRVIRYYGAPAILHYADGTAVCVRAFIRPVTARSAWNLHRALDDLGQLPVGMFLYLGPADRDILQAQWIACGEERFAPRRSEQILFGGEAVYCWGLLEKEGAADDEGAG